MIRSEPDTTLLALLKADPQLRERGYTAFLGEPTGVAIDRGGHFRGLWQFDGQAYAWTFAGYGEPAHIASNAEEAVLCTLRAIGSA